MQEGTPAVHMPVNPNIPPAFCMLGPFVFTDGLSMNSSHNLSACMVLVEDNLNFENFVLCYRMLFRLQCTPGDCSHT